MSITDSHTWKRLENNWKNGFESLTREEKEAIALWWLESETMNGTLDQFFHNSSGDLALIALSGLESLSTPVTLQAFRSSLSYFGHSYPTDRNQRMATLEEIEARHGADVFAAASRVIQDLPENFLQSAVDRLELAYART